MYAPIVIISMTYLDWTVSSLNTVLRILLTQAGAKKKCNEIGIPFLGDIPLHPDICASADTGKPTVVANPDTPQAQSFDEIAKIIASSLKS